MTRIVGVISGSRADYGIYRPVLRAIESAPDLRSRLLVCGMHLSNRFGHTVDAIEQDGFPIAARIETLGDDDSPRGIAESMARGVAGFAAEFAAETPDILLLLGDRYEMFAAAAAATAFAIPLAHIHGGELSEGAIDDAFRHSITKMSHVHFVSTEEHGRRVLQLGENPAHVHVTGAPALDNIAELALPDRQALEKTVGIALTPPPVLATFHPATLDPGSAAAQMREVLGALDDIDRPVVLTYPNADAESEQIITEIESFVAGRRNAVAIPSLGMRGYFGLMREAFAMVGNSSSGIIEAASFGLPVVNVGDRQRGRTRGVNVIDVPPRRMEIRAALARAADPEFRSRIADAANPYGDGKAAPRIARLLAATDLGPALLKKRFHDAAGSRPRNLGLSNRTYGNG